MAVNVAVSGRREQCEPQAAGLRSPVVLCSSLLVEPDHVSGIAVRWACLLRPTQKCWDDVPTLTAVRDDRDRLLVIARKHANDDRITLSGRLVPSR